ncbi:hypothetical protein Cni_G08910 [Canna indica]|uniref:Uncharacterized protein n=1 Tax=Canna indica TaxID=4628 RepID=A0AAQ3K4T5_9LILI|nr:hypothetical protein Cni_G08910 [Canna indica]
MESVVDKQKRVADALTWWNKNSIGNLEAKLKETLQKLNRLEKKDSEGWLTEDELIQMGIVARKARCKWVEEGEKNTKFFHNLVKVKRRRNKIEGIEMEGEYVTDRKKIADVFAGWYEKLWEAPEDIGDSTEGIDNFAWKKISDEER